MARNKLIVFALTALVAALLIVTGARSGAQNQALSTKQVTVVRRQRDVRPPSRQDAGDVNQLPVADYAAAGHVPEKRKAKNERHKDRLPHQFHTAGKMPVTSTLHFWEGLSALPADRSDAVVIGDVVDAQAVVTDDRKGVYSEFTIKVGEVLKGNGHRLAGSLVVDREGGAVRFQDGQVNTFRVLNMGMPRLGGRYVFFLEAKGNDFDILTAYELHEGKVYPLDGAGSNNLLFSKYAGAEVEAFMSEVRSAVAQLSKAKAK